jgi:hypothetical protein
LFRFSLQTLATAVVQLFLSEPPTHSRWFKQLTGVACFVKDNNRKNYFVRVFDLDTAHACVWQQELYYGFLYKCPRPYFHTFEADDCMAALNFASDLEAEHFHKVILEKVTSMAQRALGTHLLLHNVSQFPSVFVSPSSRSFFRLFFRQFRVRDA